MLDSLDRQPGLRIGLVYLLFGALCFLLVTAVAPRLADDPAQWRRVTALTFLAVSTGLIVYLVARERSLIVGPEAGEEEEEAEGAGAEDAAGEPYYRSLFERNAAGAFRTSREGEILDCNRALARLLGYDEAEEAIGTRIQERYADPARREEWVERALETGQVRNVEVRIRPADGDDVWARLNAGLLEEDPDEPPAFAGTLVDVTEEKQLRDQLETYAHHDSLTGLPNRRYLKDEAGAVLSKARRDGDTVAVLYLDLHRFKRVNDTLGHEAGDSVLHEVGQRLNRTIREEDMVARIGGDEFAALLNTVDDEAGALAAARRLTEALAAPFSVGDRSLHLDVDAGIALFPSHGRTFAELLSRADEAMHGAEEEREGIAVYTGSPPQLGQDRIAAEEDFRRALDENQLTVYYQPVFQVDPLQVRGAEALARWDHPEYGIRTRGEFIPIAEATGLVREVDRRVMRQVVRDAETYTANGDLGWISLNVSPQSLEHRGTLEELADRVEGSDLRDGSLVVEVTESTAMRDPRSSAHVFRELMRHGARIAIDDFGTGYSALGYLRSLPADLIKLDIIFLRGIGRGEPEDRLLQGVVGLGKTLGVQLVAEGVESGLQYERLKEYGCDLCQGFYLGRPMPRSELEELLAGNIWPPTARSDGMSAS